MIHTKTTFDSDRYRNCLLHWLNNLGNHFRCLHENSSKLTMLYCFTGTSYIDVDLTISLLLQYCRRPGHFFGVRSTQLNNNIASWWSNQRMEPMSMLKDSSWKVHFSVVGITCTRNEVQQLEEMLQWRQAWCLASKIQVYMFVWYQQNLLVWRYRPWELRSQEVAAAVGLDNDFGYLSAVDW